jgi:hypothetical protein
MTQTKIIPTNTQWNNYLNNINGNVMDDFCKAPIISFMHVPDQHTIALLSLRGTGGRLVRHVVQQTTRLWTGTEQPGLLLEQFLGNFDSEGASSYHYKHFVLTRFITPASISKEKGYVPTKIIHLVRNPFVSVISAYRYHLGCVIENSNGIACNERHLKLTDFSNKTKWYSFAENYAEEWAKQFNYIKTYPFSLTIYYENLMENTLIELSNILYFINNNLMIHPKESLECAKRLNKVGMETIDFTKRKTIDHDKLDNIFTIELIMRMCLHVKEFYNVTIFKNSYC